MEETQAIDILTNAVINGDIVLVNKLFKEGVDLNDLTPDTIEKMLDGKKLSKKEVLEMTEFLLRNGYEPLKRYDGFITVAAVNDRVDLLEIIFDEKNTLGKIVSGSWKHFSVFIEIYCKAITLVLLHNSKNAYNYLVELHKGKEISEDYLKKINKCISGYNILSEEIILTEPNYDHEKHNRDYPKRSKENIMYEKIMRLKQIIVSKSNDRVGKKIKNAVQDLLENDYPILKIFEIAREFDHLDFAKWLYEKSFEPGTPMDIHNIFRLTLELDYMRFTKWLYNKSFEILDLTQISDKFNYLDFAKWLYEKSIELGTPIDIHMDNELFFRKSCKCGNILFVKWIIYIGKETGKPIDIHALNDWAFQVSCHYGNLETAKFLVNYGLQNNTPVNIYTDCDYAFDWSYRNNHVEIIVWLLNISKRKLSSYDICGAFSYSCDHGYFELAKILYQYSVDNNYPIDIHEENEVVFRWSCVNGHFEIAYWLYNIGISQNNPINIHVWNDSVFRHCKHPEIMSWLQTLE